jgi:hypothetical protein
MEKIGNAILRNQQIANKLNIFSTSVFISEETKNIPALSKLAHN